MKESQAENETAPPRIYRAGDVDTLADLVTSRSPIEQLAGRALACGILEDVQRWVNSELERETEVSDILSVIMNLQIQAIASVASSLVTEESYREVADFYSERVREVFAHHARALAAIQADQEAL